MKLDRFINRPVLSTVISIFMVILGVIGLVFLPITQYPDIAPPTIQVSTTYTGANAQTILNSVIAPLEESINGVENMLYMTSTATNTGSASINVYFKQGTDPDMAAVNVQNRVSQASALLPSEVTRNGVTVQKQQSSTVLMIVLKSSNPNYDDKFLQNYTNINILPQVKRVMGVGDATVYGAKDYTMRVWLKPDVMKSYNITPAEVTAALQDQNIEAAPGELGANSNQSFQYALKYSGRLKNAEEFLYGIEKMVTKLVSDNGQPVEEYQKLFSDGRKEIGKCPRCGNKVYVGNRNYYCSGSDCNFTLWKNNRFFECQGKTLDEATVRKLLSEKQVHFKDLVSEKTKRKYEATIKREV